MCAHPSAAHSGGQLRAASSSESVSQPVSQPGSQAAVCWCLLRRLRHLDSLARLSSFARWRSSGNNKQQQQQLSQKHRLAGDVAAALRLSIRENIQELSAVLFKHSQHSSQKKPTRDKTNEPRKEEEEAKSCSSSIKAQDKQQQQQAKATSFLH